MTWQFTVSPDFGPDAIFGWQLFNTWLQQVCGSRSHFEPYGSFAEQRKAIAEGKVDLIYANPYDAAMLVRSEGFTPLARPAGRHDEALIVTSAASPAHSVEDLQSPLVVACADHPDIRLIGRILLEPADLVPGEVSEVVCDTYVQAVKAVLTGRAHVGVLYRDAFEDLSSLAKRDLKVLVASQIGVLHHSLMTGPALVERRAELLELLCAMHGDRKGADVLAAVGISHWEPVTAEEGEFMIDLMDALL